MALIIGREIPVLLSRKEYHEELYRESNIVKGMVIFISSLIPDELSSMLENQGDMRFLPPCCYLPVPVQTHADMLVFASHNYTLFIPENYYIPDKMIFDGFNTVRVRSVAAKYPYDIALNALPLGNDLLCKAEFTATEIKASYNPINVNQGYARCSCLKLNDSAIITADSGLSTAAKSIGCDTLLISNGNIRLPGYSYGFIGGCSAVLDDTVFFFGDITKHPDYNKIKEFITLHDKKIKTIPDMPLTDFGGAVIL